MNENLLTLEYIQNFKQNGKKISQQKPEPHHLSGEPSLSKGGLNESEENAFWAILQLVRKVDQKVDMLGEEMRATLIHNAGSKL